MNCVDVNERLPDLLDGSLGPEVRRALLAHATGCDCCRELVRTYEHTVHLSAETRAAEVPEAACAAFEGLLANLD